MRPIAQLNQAAGTCRAQCRGQPPIHLQAQGSIIHGDSLPSRKHPQHNSQNHAHINSRRSPGSRQRLRLLRLVTLPPLLDGQVCVLSIIRPEHLTDLCRFASQPSSAQLQTSSEVLESARELLDSCSTNHYLLVSQPNIHATDLHAPSGCQSANLCRALQSDSVQGQFTVTETIGSLSFDDFSDYIKAKCMAKGRHATVQEHQLRSLPTAKGKKERAAVVDDNGTRSIPTPPTPHHCTLC